MPVSFPSSPARFVGRDEYIARYRSRLEHFQVFMLGGLPGVGKTSLALKLASEFKSLGAKGAVYLPLWPNETIVSIIARVEAKVSRAKLGGKQSQGDPYARLTDFLGAHRLALVLDDIHNLKREDLLALLRATRIKEGPYRIIAAGRGDPDLAAVDRMKLHIELVGPLKADEVHKIATQAGLNAEKVQLLTADAARGGCTAHPLTLRYLLSVFGNNLPPQSFFDGQSARSVNAFKALLGLALPQMETADITALKNLCRVGVGLERKTASKAFGAAIARLVKKELVSSIDGDLYPHFLVSQALLTDEVELGSGVTRLIARQLSQRATAASEPLLALRAAELYARLGSVNEAVDLLTDAWDAARDLGFLEAFLKSVAAIPSKPALDSRLKLLSARARMQQGRLQSVREELEQLSEDRDAWTRARAHAALTYVYGEVGDPKRAVAAYEVVKRSNLPDEIAVPAAVTAAQALVRLNRIDEAEKQVRATLARIRASKLFADRQGELHRLLARIHGRAGRLPEAVVEAQAAAKAFEAAGDLYHAATAHGFIGDIYRELGDFEQAKVAFARFHELAARWGDRDLLQVAELADAWVSLDIGDLTRASRQIAAVEREMSAAPSRRLRRYLAAARALLAAGRGHHDEAAELLVPVIEAWQSGGQRNVADVLRAQRIRSLIACNQLDKARTLVDDALARLDPKTEAPRVASFLRESALIRLRRKDAKRAMSELAQARKLFAAGGNRREEALTLYRLAHAAFEEGDLDTAAARAREALALARKITHTRVIALSRELQGRLALIADDGKTAAVAAKEAMQSLRKLGDEIGALHVSESLLRALIVNGDQAGAIRLGPRVSDQAEKLEIRDIRIRAVVLTGVALIRRGRFDAAARCFRELPDLALSPTSAALMWRFGEALASVTGNTEAIFERRSKWVAALKRLPETQQLTARHALEQLDLPPHDRCVCRTPEGEQAVTTEAIAWLELPATVDLFVDVQNGRLIVKGQAHTFDNPNLHRLFNRLVIAAPQPLDKAAIYTAAVGEVPSGKYDKRVKSIIGQLDKQLKDCKGVKVSPSKDGLKLVLPRSYAFLIPRAAFSEGLSVEQRKILRLLRRYGTQSAQALQDRLRLNRAVIRRELGGLLKRKLIGTVRDGRGQAFRLS